MHRLKETLTCSRWVHLTIRTLRRSQSFLSQPVSLPSIYNPQLRYPCLRSISAMTQTREKPKHNCKLLKTGETNTLSLIVLVASVSLYLSVFRVSKWFSPSPVQLKTVQYEFQNRRNIEAPKMGRTEDEENWRWGRKKEKKKTEMEDCGRVRICSKMGEGIQ